MVENEYIRPAGRNPLILVEKHLMTENKVETQPSKAKGFGQQAKFVVLLCSWSLIGKLCVEVVGASAPHWKDRGPVCILPDTHTSWWGNPNASYRGSLGLLLSSCRMYFS